jgi:hypothetical protein
VKGVFVQKTAPEDIMAWLNTKPRLNEICSAYPDVWENVQREVAGIVTGGTTSDLQSYLKQSALQTGMLAKRLQKNREDRKIRESISRQFVHSYMARLAVKQHCISEATGVEKGKVRFNLLNGFIAQKLLFSDGLVRKPVSMFWFRVFWPMLRQKRMLMPLVQPEGIYCFYSKQLIEALAEMMASRSCLEIAAGDGTLSRFLRNAGIAITATDDYSWTHEVTYPESVIRIDAREALQQYAPEVAICSWPPADNTFERQVFRTRSVQLYIVIGSRHRLASGNWSEYKQQSTFEFKEEQLLSQLVLPPELDAAVYVFRRKPVNRIG